MMDMNIFRLFISQAFTIYLALLLIPLKNPGKKNTSIIIALSALITLINAGLIFYFGIAFYVRYYLLTLTIPHVIVFFIYAHYKGSKLFFALLSTQIIGNFAVINGLMLSYLFYRENTPLLDALGRLLTYIPLLYATKKYIRPSYLKMAASLDRGWWVLNLAMLSSYVLMYFILFVPSPIFERPIYFIHGYIGIVLSLVIYNIMYFLFEVIVSKQQTETDKTLLSMKISTLSKEAETITTIAQSDALTGLKNRYALYKDLDQLILHKTPFLLVFKDLNALKTINDQYSHKQGDIYLASFAKTISNLIGNTGTSYRFAGDEFVSILTHNMDMFNVNEFKLKVAEKIKLDVDFLGFSAGLASYPSDGLNVDELIDIADNNMYKDKRGLIDTVC